MSHIYDYIAAMKARPGMFTAEGSLSPLELLLHGYCVCLQTHGIEEEYEGRPFQPVEFSAWLYEEFGWSGSLGFADAIERNSSDPNASLETFFSLVDRFRYSERLS